MVRLPVTSACDDTVTLGTFSVCDNDDVTVEMDGLSVTECEGDRVLTSMSVIDCDSVIVEL